MIGGINMVVAFTGYRPEKMPFVESKKDEAYHLFRYHQFVISGTDFCILFMCHVFLSFLIYNLYLSGNVSPSLYGLLPVSLITK